MAKVVRIRPVDSGTVRVELGVKMEDLRTAMEFDPRSLQVLEKDTKEVLFELLLGSEPTFGKYAMVVPENLANDRDVEFLIHNVDESITTTSNLANFVRYGKTIKTQIDKAIKSYNEAAKSITVEGEDK